MAAVVAFTAPVFLLACVTIFQNADDILEEVLLGRSVLRSSAIPPDLQDYQDSHESSHHLPTPSERVSPRSQDTEIIIADVLERCDANSTAFLRRRNLAEKFITEATAHLAKLSPLLANVTWHHDGSAYEGTQITDSADFDTYALLNADALLGYFELQRGAEGRISARLRPGINRGALSTELELLVARDGYLDARLFKKWAFTCLETALRQAADSHPRLKPVIYSTHGAAGANLTAPDGALLQVDFTAQLAPPPTTGVLRSEALRPCGLNLVPPGRAAPWSVYSSVDLRVAPSPVLKAIANTTTTEDANDGDVYKTEIDTDERWFVINTMNLEGRLLSAQPSLRSTIRLLKLLSAAGRWEERYHVASVVLKHAVFWAFVEGCDTAPWESSGGLLSPTIASLWTLESALLRGRMDKFFVARPSDNALDSVAGGRPAMLRLAEEIRWVIRVLLGGDHDAISRLFKI